MTTYSNNLAWEIPWSEEPGGPALVTTQPSATERVLLAVIAKNKLSMWLRK